MTMNLEKIKGARRNIQEGFTWSETSQGREYWQQVINNLKSLNRKHKCPDCNCKLEGD